MQTFDLHACRGQILPVSGRVAVKQTALFHHEQIFNDGMPELQHYPFDGVRSGIEILPSLHSLFPFQSVLLGLHS